MAILDGKHVDDSIIDSTKHRYIGMFRVPKPFPYNGYVLCPCGCVLQIYEQVFDHYIKGHFDIPQYVTIQELCGADFGDVPTKVRDADWYGR